jgi:methionyl-tRNA formyltransferase
VKLVFFGTGHFGLPALDLLKNSSHTILAVLSREDKPQGRHLKPKPSPVKEWALRNGLPVFDGADLASTAWLERLHKMKADAFVVISFGVIFSKEFISRSPLMLNVHASLLPRWRGAAPIQWAMLSGDAETGVSVQKVVEKLDAGDVLTQKKTPILAEDGIESLESRLSELGGEALVEGLGKIESGTAVFRAQDQENVTYARKLTKEDGHLDWRLSAKELADRVRALRRWPGSYSFHKGRRLLILDAAAAQRSTAENKPGQIIAASAGEGLLVTAGEGSLDIRTVQSEGKKSMPVRDFLNGSNLRPGDFFE